MFASQAWPSRRRMYFESWPPISKIVSTSGSSVSAPAAWAVISLMIASAPRSMPISLRPEPVVPTANSSSLLPALAAASPSARSSFRVASMGLPCVRR